MTDATATATLLKHMEVPGEPRVYVLGSFERRVTLYSQQTRALNLIYALIQEGRLPQGARIAVVGGGVAGLTAAAGAARRGYDVSLLEAQPGLLHLQASCDKRWLHPHIYDWPARGSMRDDTDDLEVLTWRAARAADVVNEILRGWDDVKQETGRIQVHTKVSDIHLVPSDGSSQRQLSWNSPFQIEAFDAVILAVGFGLERTVKQLAPHSYWSDDKLEADELGAHRSYLISGLGDGGLTDLLRACLPRFRHHEIVKTLGLDPASSPEAAQLATRLLEIEGQARRPLLDEAKAAHFLLREYRVLKPISGFVDAKLEEWPRPTRSIKLNGPGAVPITLDASILNRFLAVRMLDLGRATYFAGRIKPNGIKREGKRWRVLFENGKQESYDEVIIRHGTEPALKDAFPQIWKACEPLRDRNDLDQTRSRLWPDGWFLPQSGASLTAPRRPEAVSDGTAGSSATLNDPAAPLPDRDRAAKVGDIGTIGNSETAGDGGTVVDGGRDAPLAAVQTMTGEAGGRSQVAAYSVSRAAFLVPFPSKGERVIGREGLLEAVREKLASGRPTLIGQAAVFQGLGGLGKTQLAVEYAHRYRDAYPNGVYWIDADQDIDAQLTRIAVDAGWVAPESEHRYKLDISLHRLRTFSDCLIIFDNLENQAAIEPYLPQKPATPHLLATSRLEQPDFEPIGLDLLTPEQALTMLITEADRTPTNEEEEKLARTIAEQLEGLPLAIELAGAYLRRRRISWQHYLELLEWELKKALPGDLLHSFTEHERDLYRTLQVQEALLVESPRLGKILDVLTWSGAAAMGPSLMCALLEVERPVELYEPLAVGVELRLLIEEKTEGTGDEPRYRLHRLVQRVRREQISLDEREPWARALVRHLGDWFETHRQDFVHLPIYEAEMDHLRAWLGHASERGWSDVVRLTWLQAYPPYHRGRYSESRQWVDAAVALSARHSAPPELEAHLANDLGTTTGYLGDHRWALELKTRALEIRQKVLGEEHPDTARSLDGVGASYGNLGDHRRALELKTRALEIRQRVLGEEHPDTARSLNSVGASHSNLGNHRRALELETRALEIRQRILGEEHPDTARSLDSVGVSHSHLGDHRRALELKTRALEIRQKVLGEEHPDTASSLDSVGASHSNLGNHRRALELNTRALEIRQKVLGEEHPDTARSLDSVGASYANLGDHRRALELAQRTLEIRQKVLGEEHPDTARSLDSVGASHSHLGNHRRALELAQRTLEIRQKVLGEEHPDTARSLDSVGVSYANLGDHRRALELKTRALEIRQRVLGEEHPDTASSLDSVGASHSHLRNHRRALELAQRALEIRQRVLGEEHPDTASSLDSVGASHSHLRNHHRALELAQRALEIRQKVLGEEHPDTARSLDSVGVSFSNLGDHRSALAFADKALMILKKSLGPGHERTVQALANRALILKRLGRQLEAFREVEACLKTLEPSHPQYGRLVEVGRQVTPAGFRPPSAAPSAGSSKKGKKNRR